MLQGGPSNPLGYFEAYGVIHVNDWILRKAGSTWYDCLGCAPDSLDPVTRGTAMALINICVSVEFGGASLMLLKDSRLCLLLEHWLPMLDATHIAPTVLLVLRHPAEVIASLAQRDVSRTSRRGDVVASHAHRRACDTRLPACRHQLQLATARLARLPRSRQPTGRVRLADRARCNNRTDAVAPQRRLASPTERHGWRGYGEAARGTHAAHRRVLAGLGRWQRATPSALSGRNTR